MAPGPVRDPDDPPDDHPEEHPDDPAAPVDVRLLRPEDLVDLRMTAVGCTVDDGAASPRELDGIDAVRTGCHTAIALTGTIVLRGDELGGRRAISLVPDRHVVVVSDGPGHVQDLKDLKPFIKEYSPILVGVGPGADALTKAGYRPDLIVGDPDGIGTATLKSGAEVVLPADPDGHAPGLERIQDLGIGAMTFPAAGTPTDLALLLVDHHGAALVVTVGSTVSLDEFFDQGRRDTNPSAVMTRLKVGPKLVDAKAVATLYRSRVSGGMIALLVFAALIAVIAALVVSNLGGDVVALAQEWWDSLVEWVRGLQA